MKNILASAFLLFSLCAVAQINNSAASTPSVIVTTIPTTDTSETYPVFEQPPRFPGGEEKMAKFLDENLKYPPSEKEKEIQGYVFVSFIVGVDGKISDAKVIKGVKAGPCLDQEALRLVSLMPNWEPGKRNGKSVKVAWILPFRFSYK